MSQTANPSTCSHGNKDNPSSSQLDSNSVVLQVTTLDNNPTCRICYSGPSRERLLKPCKCKGTIQYVHRHCLERWLETTNCETCELCHHHFTTRKSRKSCWEWCRQRETRNDRRNFFGDFVCCAFLTPLGIATFWLCAEGAIYYHRVKSSTLETVALVTLAIFLVFAYATWIILCTRYHIMIWTRWRNHNWNVRVMDRSSLETSPVSSDEPISLNEPSSGTILLEPLLSVGHRTSERSSSEHEIDHVQTPITSNAHFPYSGRVTTV